jgi:YVTN family beta-propeller protein
VVGVVLVVLIPAAGTGGSPPPIGRAPDPAGMAGSVGHGVVLSTSAPSSGTSSPATPQPGNGSISLASIPVGAGPTGAAVDATSGWIYVTNQGSDNVTVINGTSVVASIPVGSFPWEAAFDAANGYVYVANRDSNNLSVIHGTAVVGTVNVSSGPGGIWGQAGLTVDPVNGYVYVADWNWGPANVSVVNGTTLVAEVSVGQGMGGPGAVVADPITGFVYVANTYDSTVSIINGTSIVSTVSVTCYPVTGAFDLFNGFVYVISPCWDQYQDTPGVIAIFNGTSIASRDSVGVSPTTAVSDPLRGTVYIANTNSNTISFENGIGPRQLSVGNSPEGIGFDSLNGYAYVANYRSANVSVISTTTVIASIPVGGGPESATFDPVNGYVYVLNSWSANVTVVDGPHTYPASVSFSVSPPTVHLNQPTTFQANATGGEGNWSYAYSGLPLGCASSNTATLNCTPTQPGLFTVQVDAFDAFGLAATGTSLLTVLPGNISYFAADPSTLEIGSRTLSTTTFGVRAVGEVGTLRYSYTGLPGGCLSLDTASLACTPTLPGVFLVRAYVNDSAGNMLTTSTSLTVDAVLTISALASSNTTDIGASVSFSSTAAGGIGPDRYAWSFGDGQSAVSATATHVYASPGKYSAEVWVNDTAGGESTARLWLLANPSMSVNATVSATSTLIGSQLQFSAQPAGGTSPYSFVWRFDDGGVNETADGLHTFWSVGTHVATLVVTDSAGASRTVNVSVQVEAGHSTALPPPETTEPDRFPLYDAILLILAGVLIAAVVVASSLRRRSVGLKASPRSSRSSIDRARRP